MAVDIDMEKYAGEVSDPAAAGPVSSNSYQQEQQENAQNPLDLPEQTRESVDEVNPQPTRQELNFRALSDEVERLKAEKVKDKQDYELQLQMLKANIAQKQDQPATKKEMFHNLAPDEIPNVSQIRQEWAEKESAYQARLEELEVAQLYPDYAEVISKHTLPLIKDKPSLAQGFQGAQNKALFAYELGKMAMQLQQSGPQQSTVAQKIVENSKKPGTLSGAGGSGALSKADYYATMSDQEFMKMASRHLEGI